MSQKYLEWLRFTKQIISIWDKIIRLIGNKWFREKNK